MRILVAEDEADLARTLRKALTEDGYAVDCTPNGDAALEKATAIPYDTILLDVMLPGRSGLAVLAALRARGDPHAGPHPDGARRASTTRSAASTSAPTTT